LISFFNEVGYIDNQS